jgi:hypothetical protein
MGVHSSRSGCVGLIQMQMLDMPGWSKHVGNFGLREANTDVECQNVSTDKQRVAR